LRRSAPCCTQALSPRTPGYGKLARLTTPQVALTDRFCSTAKADVRTDYFDQIVPGLALRVTSTCHRSWSFTFTSPRDGKRARATLGSYPSTSLAVAREKANAARGYVDDGKDPRLILAGQDAAGMTIADLVGAYLQKPRGDALAHLCLFTPLFTPV